MNKMFFRIVAAFSLLAAILLSPNVTKSVDGFVNHFPKAAEWLRPLIIWVVIPLILFACCFIVSLLLEFLCMLAGRRWRAKKVQSIHQLVDMFRQKMRRFAMELSQEASADAQALDHFMQTDEMCLRELEIIHHGPGFSFQHLPAGYDAERELLEATFEHYKVELASKLRDGERTDRQRVSAASYGAQCVELLAARISGLLAQKASGHRSPAIEGQNQ